MSSELKGCRNTAHRTKTKDREHPQHIYTLRDENHTLVMQERNKHDYEGYDLEEHKKGIVLKKVLC